MADTTQGIGGRYLLHELPGAGGTGKVYRATDRLTSGTAALKRVCMQLDPHRSATATDVAELEAIRLSLANEFRVLSSLRHLGIINVLDYGFDEDGQPYFTRVPGRRPDGAARPAVRGRSRRGWHSWCRCSRRSPTCTAAASSIAT